MIAVATLFVRVVPGQPSPKPGVCQFSLSNSRGPLPDPGEDLHGSGKERTKRQLGNMSRKSSWHSSPLSPIPSFGRVRHEDRPASSGCSLGNSGCLPPGRKRRIVPGPRVRFDLSARTHRDSVGLVILASTVPVVRPPVDSQKEPDLLPLRSKIRSPAISHLIHKDQAPSTFRRGVERVRHVGQMLPVTVCHPNLKKSICYGDPDPWTAGGVTNGIRDDFAGQECCHLREMRELPAAKKVVYPVPCHGGRPVLRVQHRPLQSTHSAHYPLSSVSEKGHFAPTRGTSGQTDALSDPIQRMLS